MDKLEKKIESLTPAPTPASEHPLSVIHPAPASTSTPIEIPPAIKEVLRPSAKPSSKPKPPSKHSPDSAKPVMSEARDRQLIYEGIITCLSATGNPKIGVYFEDILIYLEKVIGAGRARRISAPGCRGSLPCSRPLPTGCIYSRRGSGLRASGGLGISTCSESHLGERPG